MTSNLETSGTNKLNKLSEPLTINEKELEILKFWNENNIFEKSILSNGEVNENNKYTFYDGPPFATGLPHHGTVLQSCIKDAIPRYQTMQGKNVRRVWGWDCHGLPIENLIEKEIGLKNKQDIENYGIENFNRAAANSVYRYEEEWKKIIPRLGRWIDMDNAYATINSTFTESVWWSFSELYKKGLVYEGYKIMHICPRCETPLAQSEVNQPGCYKDVTDISVYIPFEIISEDEKFKNAFLLAWTTTPWTLPGNTAIAINKNLIYVKVEIENKFYIIAKDRMDDIFKIKSGKLIEELLGEELIGLSYKPIFDYFNNEEFLKTLDTEKSDKENIYKVWHADFVTSDTGTGIAHEAPAFGEEDYVLAQENRIPTILHVKMNGQFINEVKDFVVDGQGLKVKKKDDTQSTDIEIIKYLAHNGKLFHKQKIIHPYPHCWRCDTPLLNYATSSWYVNVTKIKDQLIEKNKKINWIPEHVRDGRFGKWLEGARDWAITRNRYWGAPIPVWKTILPSHQGEGLGMRPEIFVPRSLQELQQRTKAKNTYTFIRHGEAYSNLNGTINSIITNDKGLTENGFKKINEIKINLQKNNLKYDLVISSPFLRTRQTAEIISNNNYEIDERLREFLVDESWEGKTWSELYEASRGNYFNKAIGRLESRYDLSLRVARLIYELEEKHEGKNILLVAHSSAIEAINVYNSGLIYEKSGKGPLNWKHYDNGEIFELNFKPLPHDENGEVNFHIPFIDKLDIYDLNGNKMKRNAGVFDCWYESGSMPYGQFHYPFENEQLFKQNFPADFIAEAVDQTRGWFYSMFVLNVALFDESAYKNVICTGHIMATDGKKISKSLKNYTDPLLIIEKYGLDAMRYYLISSPVVNGEAFNFSDNDVDLIYKKNISRLLNVLSFYKMYKTEESKPSSNSNHVIDKYILTRLKEVRLKVAKGFDELKLDEACRPIDKFIDDLSVWYLRRSRDRLKSDNVKIFTEAIETLHYVLYEFAKILAPIMPFTAEIIWQDVKSSNDPESVHLTKWNIAELTNLNEEEIMILNQMSLARELVTEILDQRIKANIKVRQPLSGILIKITKYNSLKNQDQLLAEICDEVNIKFIKYINSNSDEIEYRKRDMGIFLDTNITKELKEEGQLRELTRFIQDKRKEDKFNAEDKVTIYFGKKLLNIFTEEFINKFKSEIEKGCNVTQINFTEDDSDLKIIKYGN